MTKDLKYSDKVNARSLSDVIGVSFDALEKGINEVASGGPSPDALLKDGSVPLDAGFTPANDQDLATKKYVDDNSGGGVASVNGDVGPAVVLGASDVGAYTTGEVDTALSNKTDTSYVNQFFKNIAPVTTFMTSGPISQVITAGQTVDIFDVFGGSFSEFPKICIGATPLDINSTAFSSFLDVANGRIIFPDVDTTTSGLIDVREVSVSCRVSGTFTGNGDATVLVQYWELDGAGALQTLIGAMPFERQFQQDFDARASSLVSRLSKDNSALVQNGAKFIITIPSSATEDFTLTQLDFLINIGS